MKSSQLLVIAFVLALGFLAPAALGQGNIQCGGNWMNPGYSLYTSVSVDDTYLYTNAQVEGTTTGVCPTYCGFCSTGTHTPIAKNIISWSGGSVGNNAAGPAQLWNSYISYANNQQVAYADDTDYTFLSEGRIACNIAGIILYDLVKQSFVSIRDTYFGPPPYNDTPSTCGYNILACSTGNPTCKGATPGFVWAFTCPKYIKAENAVVDGYCMFANAFAATGPGPCN